MRIQIVVTHDNGVISYTSNADNSSTIALLEAAKYAILRQAMGGLGRPPSEPEAPASGGVRAPGLSVRKLP